MISSTLFVSVDCDRYDYSKSIIAQQVIFSRKIKYYRELNILNFMILKKLYLQRHIFCSSLSSEKYVEFPDAKI